ncbi:helix-turn-helix domain-containing protein [Lelliottia wanjuensis]|uniref:Helix-turn-helix domain-containing protein n=1 Tax=Lelliottia wanjuensis TaxID=3050585 RepID=A0AAP4FW43_9ENTR|nr:MULTISPECIES: helix-turn-helix domain-containing protein [unclassified Lelliottia]MDK9364204.1 helix-turn-helix domain-containing protein [Lelliottia sp. V106_12]MDK9617119.1 helix-turn-helix domain-containing protein [Lelliottia sp. V106_9]
MNKDTESQNKLADRLNELLRLKGINKMELAKIAEVSPQSVNGWFKRGSISKASAIKIAAALDVSLSWLLGESEEPDTDLSSEEKRLLEVFNRLPPIERNNMLAAFEMRLQELISFYEKYANPNGKGK